MKGVYKVNESKRTIKFVVDVSPLELTDVVEVDNTGSYLRITTKTKYYLINPAHVLYHEIHGVDKVF
jgi:hypothetical protein